MTAFSDWYKKNIYKANAQERLDEIGVILGQVGMELEKTNDPGQWNRLLDRMEMLQMEQQELVESCDRIHG